MSRIARKITASQFNLERLVDTLCDDDNTPWRRHLEIIPDYMPPYPHKDTRPTVQIRCGEWFVRHSKGPWQSYFWDMYGDDFITPELALAVLPRLPEPPRGKPYVEFTIPLAGLGKEGAE